MNATIVVRFTLSRRVAILALTDYYYDKSGGSSKEEEQANILRYTTELNQLTKTEARKIIRSQLLHYGYQGAYQDGFFEAATDVIEVREYWLTTCTQWVIQHYPALK